MLLVGLALRSGVLLLPRWCRVLTCPGCDRGMCGSPEAGEVPFCDRLYRRLSFLGCFSVIVEDVVNE